jgi:hypothetical protein
MHIKKIFMFVSLTVFLIIISVGCSSYNQTYSTEYPELPTTETSQLESEHLTLKLNFKGDILRADGSKQAWTQDTMKPFVDALESFSKVIKGVKGKENHTLTIDIHVNDFNGGNGAATVDYSNLIMVDNKPIPTQGYIVINNRLYDEPEVFESLADNPDIMSEFNANIHHEMGHVFGIGCLWEVVDDSGNKIGSLVESEKSTGTGRVSYNMPKTIVAYNKIFGTQLDFVPISDDDSHFYDYAESNDKKRTEGIWKNIKSAPYDLMANGYTITMLTASALDDIGWDIDYSYVKEYIIN